MTHLRAVALVAVWGSLAIGGAPAQAGLVGSTVQAFYYSNPPSIPSGGGCDAATQSYCEQEANSSQNTAPTIPTTFVQAANDGSTIDVADAKITITNDISATFCLDGVSVGSACADTFDGFEFLFSSGVNITNVTVDSASPGFQPNDTSPHVGIKLLSPTDVLVDLTGANPALGGQLVLDVTTGGSGPTVPEPSTWAMMLMGFAGLGFAAHRRAGVAARAA